MESLKDRFQRHTVLTPAELAALRGPLGDATVYNNVPIRRASGRLRFLAEGWSLAMVRLTDGRKPIVRVNLPGDPIDGIFDDDSVEIEHVAVGPVVIVDLTLLRQSGFVGFSRVLQHESSALQHRLNAGILRLGHMTAAERTIHFMLEMDARWRAEHPESGDSIPFPLRQQHLADCLGLSVVHVNRTLQALRRDGLIRLERGELCLRDRHRLTLACGYPDQNRRAA